MASVGLKEKKKKRRRERKFEKKSHHEMYELLTSSLNKAFLPAVIHLHTYLSITQGSNGLTNQRHSET